MDDITTTKAMEMIRNSYTLKSDLASTWAYADEYYNNKINTINNFGQDPTRLANWDLSTDHIENIIPHLMRTYAAWVVNQPFDILASPQGSKNDYFNLVVANTVQDCLEYYSTRPKFSADLREIAIRMKLYNAVAQVDYYDFLNERPASRLVPHTDIHFDPTAIAPVNEVGGPRSIAIRLLLTPDEAINRYGRNKVAGMQRGLVSPFEEASDPKSEYPNYYGHMYDVYEWYGYDYTLVPVPAQETQDIVTKELSAWMGDDPVSVDPDIDHELAVREGIKLMYVMLKEEPASDVSLETTLYRLSEVGMGRLADILATWAQEHNAFLEEGDAGGSRPKYSDFVYRAEMQYGNDDWLKEPRELDYPHGQIPVSFYRNHITTDGLFGAGPFTEVINIHRRLDKYKENQYTYVDMASSPPFIIDLDLMHPGYADSMMRKGILSTLKAGLKPIFTRSSASPGAKEPSYAKMPPMSYDVYRVIEYLEYKIQEIIGPTKVMRGDVSGEVSGKAFSMRQQAAAKPVADVLLQIEGPMQQHIQRMASIIMEYLPYEKIANISGQEGAEAIQQFRDRGEVPECAVLVRFGRGMPTDWETKNAWGMQMLEIGAMDIEAYGKLINSPADLNQPPPPPSQGMAQGGIPQGVTSNA